MQNLRSHTVGTLVGAALILSCAQIHVLAQSPKLPGIESQVQAAIQAHEISGAVTLVANRERILHLEAVGMADIADNRPMKPDAMFWIASMTKPITGAAVLMLQDEGKLNVDDPVAKYLPEFQNLKTPSGKPANLTLRHLLTHTSGLAEAGPEDSKAARTLADLIPAFLKQPTQFEPGSRWQYCQSGINTAARVVEVVSGLSFPDFLQARLFTPLGMKDTTFYPSKEQVARIATSYKKTGANLESVGVFSFGGKDPSNRDRPPLANGGLYSTAADYARFLRMVLNAGELDGKRYLKAETVKFMTTVQSGDVKTGFTPGNGWGIAWCVVREPQGVSAMLSPGSCGHGGAYGTQAWIDPVKGVAYVLMVQRANFPNSDDSPLRKAFQQAAADALAK